LALCERVQADTENANCLFTFNKCFTMVVFPLPLGAQNIITLFIYSSYLLPTGFADNRRNSNLLLLLSVKSV
jgi:hypothetical protein